MGKWFKAAIVRALKTAAQAALAVAGTTHVWYAISWPLVGWVSLTAAVLSLITSLAGIPEVEDGANVIVLADDDDGGSYS